MVEITRRNLARGNIITAAYLGIQRVNNEKGRASFENAEIMPIREKEGRQREGEREKRSRKTVARVPERAMRRMRGGERFFEHAGALVRAGREKKKEEEEEEEITWRERGCARWELIRGAHVLRARAVCVRQHIGTSRRKARARKRVARSARVATTGSFVDHARVSSHAMLPHAGCTDATRATSKEAVAAVAAPRRRRR